MTKTRKLLFIRQIFILFLSLNIGLVAAAQSNISGRVIGSDGKPLQGVTISVGGTNIGSSTDLDGNFSITAKKGDIITATMIGFEKSSITLADQSTLIFNLTPEVGGLNEVVVTGYGTQRRRNVTGAVASINGKTLNELPVISIPQALQGRMAGVTVTNNGSPGTQPIVRIRGISSISYASDPLYVVDGFPTADLASFDLRDIESIDVLKDASAAAIYGSRATNGVVMVTTKKGRRDSQIRVNLDSHVGSQQVNQRLDLLDTEGFKKYALAYRGSQVPRLTAPQIDEPTHVGSDKTYGETNTNWQDEYFEKGFMTGHNISLSGGTDRSRYFSSFGYLNQQGTGPSTGLERFNFRLNSENDISKMFTFGENLYLAHSDQDFDNNETGSRTNLVNVIRMMPHMPVYDPTSNGGFRGVDATKDGGDPTNPVEDAELKNPGNRSTFKLIGTAYL
ncbi:MAG: SusC/RagA family TonB-linked outer membrane protein, partial [Chitinophagaceae bacterium]